MEPTKLSGITNSFIIIRLFLSCCCKSTSDKSHEESIWINETINLRRMEALFAHHPLFKEMLAYSVSCTQTPPLPPFIFHITVLFQTAMMVRSVMYILLNYYLSQIYRSLIRNLSILDSAGFDCISTCIKLCMV